MTAPTTGPSLAPTAPDDNERRLRPVTCAQPRCPWGGHIFGSATEVLDALHRHVDSRHPRVNAREILENATGGAS